MRFLLLRRAGVYETRCFDFGATTRPRLRVSGDGRSVGLFLDNGYVGGVVGRVARD